MRRKLLARRVNASPLATVLETTPTVTTVLETTPTVTVKTVLDMAPKVPVQTEEMPKVEKPKEAWITQLMRNWAENAPISNYGDAIVYPDQAITHAEFTEILEHAKKDLPDKMVADGVKLNTDLVGEFVTRAEAALFVFSAIKLPEGAANGYVDYEEIAEDMRGAVGGLSQMGYLDCTSDGRFCPNQTMTRVDTILIINHVVYDEMMDRSAIYIAPTTDVVIATRLDPVEVKLFAEKIEIATAEMKTATAETETVTAETATAETETATAETVTAETETVTAETETEIAEMETATAEMETATTETEMEIAEMEAEIAEMEAEAMEMEVAEMEMEAELLEVEPPTVEVTLQPVEVITPVESAAAQAKRLENTYKINALLQNENTVVKNQTIAGDFFISRAVREGKVYLDHVTIKGNLIVEGGGEDSIYMRDVKIQGKLVVNKSDVCVMMSRDTVIPKIEVMERCELRARRFTGSVGVVVFQTQLVASQTTLMLDAERVEVAAPVDVMVAQYVDTLHVKKSGEGSLLMTDKNTKVANLIAEAKMTISGEGEIGTLVVNADGVMVGSHMEDSDIADIENDMLLEEDDDSIALQLTECETETADEQAEPLAKILTYIEEIGKQTTTESTGVKKAVQEIIDKIENFANNDMEFEDVQMTIDDMPMETVELIQEKETLDRSEIDRIQMEAVKELEAIKLEAIAELQELKALKASMAKVAVKVEEVEVAEVETEVVAETVEIEVAEVEAEVVAETVEVEVAEVETEAVVETVEVEVAEVAEVEAEAEAVTEPVEVEVAEVETEAVAEPVKVEVVEVAEVETEVVAETVEVAEVAEVETEVVAETVEVEVAEVAAVETEAVAETVEVAEVAEVKTEVVAETVKVEVAEVETEVVAETVEVAEVAEVETEAVAEPVKVEVAEVETEAVAEPVKVEVAEVETEVVAETVKVEEVEVVEVETEVVAVATTPESCEIAFDTTIDDTGSTLQVLTDDENGVTLTLKGVEAAAPIEWSVAGAAADGFALITDAENPTTAILGVMSNVLKEGDVATIVVTWSAVDDETGNAIVKRTELTVTAVIPPINSALRLQEAIQNHDGASPIVLLKSTKGAITAEYKGTGELVIDTNRRTIRGNMKIIAKKIEKFVLDGNVRGDIEIYTASAQNVTINGKIDGTIAIHETANGHVTVNLESSTKSVSVGKSRITEILAPKAEVAITGTIDTVKIEKASGIYASGMVNFLEIQGVGNQTGQFGVAGHGVAIAKIRSAVPLSIRDDLFDVKIATDDFENTMEIAVQSGVEVENIEANTNIHIVGVDGLNVGHVKQISIVIPEALPEGNALSVRTKADADDRDTPPFIYVVEDALEKLSAYDKDEISLPVNKKLKQPTYTVQYAQEGGMVPIFGNGAGEIAIPHETTVEVLFDGVVEGTSLYYMKSHDAPIVPDIDDDIDFDMDMSMDFETTKLHDLIRNGNAEEVPFADANTPIVLMMGTFITAVVAQSGLQKNTSVSVDETIGVPSDIVRLKINMDCIDKTKLTSLIEFMQSIDQREYTAVTWGVFVKSMRIACELLEMDRDSDVTQREIDRAAEELQFAYEVLIEKPTAAPPKVDFIGAKMRKEAAWKYVSVIGEAVSFAVEPQSGVTYTYEVLVGEQVKKSGAIKNSMPIHITFGSEKTEIQYKVNIKASDGNLRDSIVMYQMDVLSTLEGLEIVGEIEESTDEITEVQADFAPKNVIKTQKTAVVPQNVEETQVTPIIPVTSVNRVAAASMDWAVDQAMGGQDDRMKRQATYLQSIVAAEGL